MGDQPCENHDVRLTHIEDRLEKIENMFTKLLQHRLPTWAVFIMTAGGAVIGYLVK